MSFKAFDLDALVRPSNLLIHFRVKSAIFNLVVFLQAPGLSDISLFFFELLLELRWEFLLVLSWINRLELCLVNLGFEGAISHLVVLMLLLKLFSFALELGSLIYYWDRSCYYSADHIDLGLVRVLLVSSRLHLLDILPLFHGITVG